MLHLSLLPVRQNAAGLFDFRDDPELEGSIEPIQLVEGFEYRYRIDIPTHTTFETDRPEIFEADDLTGIAGRVRPGQYTGRLPIGIFSNGERIGSASLEVRSRKLDYLRDYRWMLRDLAHAAAEIIMRSFGPAVQSFEISDTGDAKTAYQRFAFLQSMLLSESFQSAIAKVLYRPHATWTEERENRNSSRGLKADSTVARAIARPGPRRSHSYSLGDSEPAWRALIPQTVQARRSSDTFDNYSNRFIKFALTRWRDECVAIQDVIRRQKQSAAVTRGITETNGAVGILNNILTHEIFAGVTALTALSFENPVLLRKEGYRELHRAFLEAEFSARLAWKGGEEVYGAGQRNVAALYEYWVFGQLAELLANICNERFDLAKLFELDKDGLNLNLKRGSATVIEGEVVRLGRRIVVTLWFNRTFGKGKWDGSSWSGQMRPDCSLRLAHGAAGPLSDDIWVHFDAKYRVDNLLEIFGGEVVSELEDTDDSATAKRDDLLKMHAYRDAIHRSSGAYVVYPGDSEQSFFKYHELLPGLGAFGLRPAENGGAQGSPSLERFLESVIDHFASQVTQHERARYWEDKSFNTEPVNNPRIPVAAFIDKPPADARVLLGYVKNAEHWTWIRREKLYNLRADQNRAGSVDLSSREMGVDLVLLYELATGAIAIADINGPGRLLTRADMRARGYPDPKSEAYYCIPVDLEQSSTWAEMFSVADIDVARQDKLPEAVRGAPVIVSWLKLTQIWAARLKTTAPDA